VKNQTLILAFAVLATLTGCQQYNLQNPDDVALLEGRCYLAGYVPLRIYFAVEETDPADVELIRQGTLILRGFLLDPEIDPTTFPDLLAEQLSLVSKDDRLDNVLAELLPILTAEVRPLIEEAWTGSSADEAAKKKIVRRCLIKVLAGVGDACVTHLRDSST